MALSMNFYLGSPFASSPYPSFPRFQSQRRHKVPSSSLSMLPPEPSPSSCLVFAWGVPWMFWGGNHRQHEMMGRMRREPSTIWLTGGCFTGQNAYSSGKLVISLSTPYEHLMFWCFAAVLSFFIVHLHICIIRVCYYAIKSQHIVPPGCENVHLLWVSQTELEEDGSEKHWPSLVRNYARIVSFMPRNGKKHPPPLGTRGSGAF